MSVMLTELIRYKHWYRIVINSGSGLLMVHYSRLWNYDMCSLIAGVHVEVYRLVHGRRFAIKPLIPLAVKPHSKKGMQTCGI